MKGLLVMLSLVYRKITESKFKPEATTSTFVQDWQTF